MKQLQEELLIAEKNVDKIKARIQAKELAENIPGKVELKVTHQLGHYEANFTDIVSAIRFLNSVQSEIDAIPKPAMPAEPYGY